MSKRVGRSARRPPSVSFLAPKMFYVYRLIGRTKRQTLEAAFRVEMHAMGYASELEKKLGGSYTVVDPKGRVVLSLSG